MNRLNNGFEISHIENKSMKIIPRAIKWEKFSCGGTSHGYLWFTWANQAISSPVDLFVIISEDCLTNDAHTRPTEDVIKKEIFAESKVHVHKRNVTPSLDALRARKITLDESWLEGVSVVYNYVINMKLCNYLGKVWAQDFDFVMLNFAHCNPAINCATR